MNPFPATYSAWSPPRCLLPLLEGFLGSGAARLPPALDGHCGPGPEASLVNQKAATWVPGAVTRSWGQGCKAPASVSPADAGLWRKPPLPSWRSALLPPSTFHTCPASRMFKRPSLQEVAWRWQNSTSQDLGRGPPESCSTWGPDRRQGLLPTWLTISGTISHLIHEAATFWIYFQAFILVTRLEKNPPAIQETPVRSLGWEDPLEKEKATHCNILVWRIPWAIQFMGSQRVRHDWTTFTHSSLKKLNGKRIWKKQLDTHIRITDPFCRAPKTSTTLWIN